MLLTDEEIEALTVRNVDARAIEAAVIRKLAAGVSVEPVIRGWMNPANGVVIDPQRKKQLGVGDGYPNFSVPLYDESGTVTRKQLRTCIAAARLKALEDAAALAEHENAADWSISGQIARQIRTLKGGVA